MPKRERGPKAKKPKAAKKAPEWTRQPLIEKIVDDLVAQHRPHLARAKILVLGRPKATQRGGKTILATAHKASKAMAALWKDASGLDIHYWIEVGLDAWEAKAVDARKIIIDHELCHFTGLNEKGTEWEIRGDHDIEEYREIVGRYGAYHDDLQAFVKAAKQMPLLPA